MCWNCPGVWEDEDEPTEAEMVAVELEELAERRAGRHRRGVRFDRARRLIEVDGNELHLDDAPNATELFIWLMDLGLHCKPQQLHDLFRELEDACHQVFGACVLEVYCPWGKGPAVVNWRQRLEELASTEKDAGESSHRGDDGKRP